jgi:glycosyltransferase involved in cell wall biosynthesis
MKILLPISLDRWCNPISTLQRACVQYNPDIEFHSFSNPETEEDRQMGAEFWKLPNLHLRKPSAILLDRFDIVHTASYSRGNYLAALIAKLRGMGHTKFLTTLNLEYDLKYAIDRLRYGRFLRIADRFVAVSEAVSADVRHRYPDRFLGVIPNGFDPQLYDPSKIDEVTLPEQVAALESGYPLWLAAVESRKNPQIFVQLAKANPSITFVALGGVLPGDGEIYADQFNATPNILWLGKMERSVARAVMAKAGVLVFPSEREGLSLGMIEAIAMGIPILAQPKSSMPELVTAGWNGELMDVSDFDAWNQSLHKWLPPWSHEQTENLKTARMEALEKFSWEVVGKSYHSVYEKLIQTKRCLFYSFNLSNSKIDSSS